MSRHTTHPTSFDCWRKDTAPNRVKTQSRTVLCHAIVAQNNHTIRLDSCVRRHSPRGHASRFGAVFLVDSVGGRDIGNHRARFQNLPIYSGTEPVYGWRQTGTVRVAMLTRHAAVMNRRAVEINSAIAPRRAKDVSRALAVFARILTTAWSPLESVRRASSSGLRTTRR